jgi:ATP-dependent RNA helicase RhlE
VTATFAELNLLPELLRAITEAGYVEPTPIQRQAIGPALAGRDIVGCAQTGTGKTAAFALPVLQRLDASAGDDPKIRALVLAPTRELAAQIGESFATYGKHLKDLWHTVIFGGVPEGAQIRELGRGVDVLVATPGRLLDLMGRRFVDLRQVEMFVLDEADHMLDMGFLPDVKRIIAALPVRRQNLLFSATMPPEIRTLTATLLRDPVQVGIAVVNKPIEKIEERLYFVAKPNKPKLLLSLLQGGAITRTLVFSRTKHGANRVVEFLEKGGVRAAAIHGNKSQGARTRALDNFKSGDLRVLVATDIAARGIDVDGVSHVINFDLPNVPETYVHRIGRTARAGAAGIALSFCDHEEQVFLRDIERLIGHGLTRVEGGEFADDPRAASNVSASNVRPPARPQPARGGQRGPRPASRGRGRGPGPGTGSRR